MPDVAAQGILEVLLDSWDRNNTILINLLYALPDGGLDVKAIEGSPTIAQLFAHIHYVRLVLVFEDAPEFARTMPEQEWRSSVTAAGSRRCSTIAPRRCETR